MALPESLSFLLQAAAFGHPCTAIRLIETHISWVLLTGDYAYKIKKPVRLPFVDFSSLARRRFFCDEEVRCNRRFAPMLYLDVVPITRAADGTPRVNAAGAGAEVIEWAVRMRQFAPELALDRLVATAGVTAAELRAFGAALAGVHAQLPRHAARAPSALAADDIPSQPVIGAARGQLPAPVERGVLAPMRENFSTLGPRIPMRERDRLARIAAASEALGMRLAPQFGARLADGWVRECHGDLHLANLVRLDDRIVAFDCLEFDADLRWIDVQADIAFLFMDCLVRERTDLGYAFLDGYLDASGDYAGASLLPFYAVYRAMVRAKVAAVQLEQRRASAVAPGRAAPSVASPVAVQTAAAPATASTDSADGTALRARLASHLAWAEFWLERPRGGVILMCGVSGSGKSWLAERLVSRLGAIRLRSDVARRALPVVSGVDRYAATQIDAVYATLANCLDALVPQGESVLVDATFLQYEHRARFLAQARAAGWPMLILHCTAPRDLLTARIRGRLAAAEDASEADLGVLAQQLAAWQGFAPDEPVVAVDTGQLLDDARLDAIASTVASRLAGAV